VKPDLETKIPDTSSVSNAQSQELTDFESDRLVEEMLEKAELENQRQTETSRKRQVELSPSEGATYGPALKQSKLSPREESKEKEISSRSPQSLGGAKREEISEDESPEKDIASKSQQETPETKSSKKKERRKKEKKEKKKKRDRSGKKKKSTKNRNEGSGSEDDVAFRRVATSIFYDLS